MDIKFKNLKDAEVFCAKLMAKVEELEGKFNTRRGPKSTRQMTEDDATRVLLGNLKEKTHNECVKELGLSYGQIYSARNGFTFKSVYKKSQKS